MQDAYIVEFRRTPFGRFGGALAPVRPDELAAHATAAVMARAPDAPIDEMILGCANQAGEDNRNVARMATLPAGLSVLVAGTTINPLGASGAQITGTAALERRAPRAGHHVHRRRSGYRHRA